MSRELKEARKLQGLSDSEIALFAQTEPFFKAELSASTAEDDLFAQTDPDSEAETETEEDPESIFMTVIDPLVDDFVENFREDELKQVIFSALNDEDAKTEENEAIREIIMLLYSTDEISVRCQSSSMPIPPSTEPLIEEIEQVPMEDEVEHGKLKEGEATEYYDEIKECKVQVNSTNEVLTRYLSRGMPIPTITDPIVPSIVKLPKRKLKPPDS